MARRGPKQATHKTLERKRKVRVRLSSCLPCSSHSHPLLPSPLLLSFPFCRQGQCAWGRAWKQKVSPEPVPRSWLFFKLVLTYFSIYLKTTKQGDDDDDDDGNDGDKATKGEPVAWFSFLVPLAHIVFSSSTGRG